MKASLGTRGCEADGSGRSCPSRKALSDPQVAFASNLAEARFRLPHPREIVPGYKIWTSAISRGKASASRLATCIGIRRCAVLSEWHPSALRPATPAHLPALASDRRNCRFFARSPRRSPEGPSLEQKLAGRLHLLRAPTSGCATGRQDGPLLALVLSHGLEPAASTWL